MMDVVKFCNCLKHYMVEDKLETSTPDFIHESKITTGKNCNHKNIPPHKEKAEIKPIASKEQPNFIPRDPHNIEDSQEEGSDSYIKRACTRR